MLVSFGDAPLLSVATLGRLVARIDEGADIAALGFNAADPTGYGRMISKAARSPASSSRRTRPPKIARSQLAVAGMLAGKAATVFDLLQKVGNQNAKANSI